MKLQITTRHFDLTPEFRSYAEDRILKLKRYFDQIIDVNMILTTEKHRHTAEITLHTNGHNLVGANESGDMKSSVEGAVGRIEAQLKKHKDRVTERKGGKRLGEAMAADSGGPSGVEIEDETEE